MKKFVLPLAVSALALAFVWVGGAAAQDAATSTVDGFIVGDRGGAHQEWTIAVPANTDAMVSVEYAPCAPPKSVAFTVYSSDGQVTPSYQVGHCKKVAHWNTASSDSATIKLSYYEHGNVLYYVVKSEGIVLTAAPAVAEEPVVEEAVVEEAEEEVAAEEVAVAEEGEVVATAPMTSEGTVLGSTGGGRVKYDITLTGGQTYTGTMTFYMDAGGVWPAVGFTVWGPAGVVAQSKSMHGRPAMVEFVAPETGKYTIDVYNYHPGRTMSFKLTGMPIPGVAQ